MTSSVRAEAARWFTRMHGTAGGPASAANTSAWRAWLAASPEHAREYAAFEALWRDFDSAPRAHALADAAQRLAGQRRQVRRRTVVRGTLGFAGLGLLGLLGRHGWNAWQDSATYAQARESGIGERVTLTLPDGSTLALGPDSSAALRYSRRQRAVVLQRGEALFDVARDASRPFVIDAGSARIIVLGTRFVVSRLPGLVRVSVAHGSVQLAAQAGGTPLLLQAGEVGELADDANALALPQRVPRNAQDAFAATERDLVIFDQASLGEIAATLSRWRRQPVRTDAPAGSGPRITAAVQARDVEGFLLALPRIAAVRVQERDGSTWLSNRPPPP
ncbi:FecR domain-containing protein [Xylophilus sp. GW821-FHT01B05]